jgi:predicted acyltransferase
MLLPGKLIWDTFDPEGLLSTLPAVVTAMLGNFAGEWVRQPEKRISGGRKAAYMAAAGVVMGIVAWAWNMVLPVNKMLWSSSFVLAVGSYSLLMFALFYYLIDVRGWRKWTLFFRVIGLNSITIYLAQKIIDFKRVANFFLGGVADMCPEDWSKVILTGGYVLACWLFLYFLYKKDTFLKV